MAVDPYVSEAEVLRDALVRPELCHLSQGEIERRLLSFYDESEDCFNIHQWEYPVSPDVAALVKGGILPGRIYRREATIEFLRFGNRPCLLCNRPDSSWSDYRYPLAYMVKDTGAPTSAGGYWKGLCSSCICAIERLGGETALTSERLFWPAVGAMIGEHAFKKRARKYANTRRRFDPRAGRALEAA